jgi:hypothetical protein
MSAWLPSPSSLAGSAPRRLASILAPADAAAAGARHAPPRLSDSSQKSVADLPAPYSRPRPCHCSLT